MQDLHSSGVGGHSGCLTTYHMIKTLFAWPGMKSAIYNFVQACSICWQAKSEHMKSLGLLQPLPTMGNRGFAECFLLCRVPNVGHLAKIDFAECRTRQRQTLGISIFAECQALGKGQHSTKPPFAECRLSAKLNTRQRLTEVTAATHRQALPSGCRQTLGKEFFKIFLIFYLFSLPSALSLALGKDPLCRVPGLALGKEFFLFLLPDFFFRVATML